MQATGETVVIDVEFSNSASLLANNSGECLRACAFCFCFARHVIAFVIASKLPFESRRQQRPPYSWKQKAAQLTKALNANLERTLPPASAPIKQFANQWLSLRSLSDGCVKTERTRAICYSHQAQRKFQQAVLLFAR